MPLLDPREGYNRYARFYRNDYAHLDSFDWETCQAVLYGLLAENPYASLLDAGCGDGRTLVRVKRKFPEASLWGWDLSEKMLEIAAKKTGLSSTLFRHDTGDMPPENFFPAGGFDLACAFFLLVHIKKPADFFAVMNHVLAPGGHLVFNNIPQRRGMKLSDGKGEFIIEYHDHSDDEISESMETCGFRVLERRRLEHSTVFLAGKNN
jgi:ubiquinone/menaquinone biosynthesis C-methylase UbiE